MTTHVGTGLFCLVRFINRFLREVFFRAGIYEPRNEFFRFLSVGVIALRLGLCYPVLLGSRKDVYVLNLEYLRSGFWNIQLLQRRSKPGVDEIVKILLRRPNICDMYAFAATAKASYVEYSTGRLAGIAMMPRLFASLMGFAEFVSVSSSGALFHTMTALL
jgi:hypothetical protein